MRDFNGQAAALDQELRTCPDCGHVCETIIEAVEHCEILLEVST
jgi:hypothetical protein